MSGTTDIIVEVERRENTGKGHARRLRVQGKIPAVVYGGDLGPAPIVVDRKQITDLLRSEAGENTIFKLKLKDSDEGRIAMIKEIQIDPLSRTYDHIDFIRIVAGHAVHVNIPVEIVGESAGEKEGGVLDMQTRELSIEVLPKDIPDSFKIDISALEIGQHISVEDIADLLPAGARFLEDGHRCIIAIEPPRTMEEEEDEDAELVVDEIAEPELIGRVAPEE